MNFAQHLKQNIPPWLCQLVHFVVTPSTLPLAMLNSWALSQNGGSIVYLFLLELWLKPYVFT